MAAGTVDGGTLAAAEPSRPPDVLRRGAGVATARRRGALPEAAAARSGRCRGRRARGRRRRTAAAAGRGSVPWPGPRYLDRRRDRDQNGAAGGFAAPPAAPLEDRRNGCGCSARPPASCRGRATPGRGPWRTAAVARARRRLRRTGGCAGPTRPGARPVAPPRAQPAEAGRCPRAARRAAAAAAAVPSVPVPDPGVRPLPGADVAVRDRRRPDIPSGTVAPAAGDAAAAGRCVGCRRPSAVPRRAQRDARAAPIPGTTTPAAFAVTRRKPKADSRQLTWRARPRRACRSRPRRTGAGTACGR